MYFPEGSTTTVPVGGALNITILLLTNDSVDPASFALRPTNGLASTDQPSVETFNEVLFYVTYSSVSLGDDGEYCVSFRSGNGSGDIGPGSGDVGPGSGDIGPGFGDVGEVCVGSFRLFVTGIIVLRVIIQLNSLNWNPVNWNFRE